MDDTADAADADDKRNKTIPKQRTSKTKNKNENR